MIFRVSYFRLHKFACSRQQKTYYFGPSNYRGIKIVGQLKQISEADRKLFVELKEPKPLLTQSFCKNEERKQKKELKLWGCGGGEDKYLPIFNWENLEQRPH